MFPRQSAPVLRPVLFATPFQEVSRPSLIDPAEVVTTFEVVTGADPDPNDPQQFLGPTTRVQDCSIFGGFSFMQCMLGGG